MHPSSLPQGRLAVVVVGVPLLAVTAAWAACSPLQDARATERREAPRWPVTDSARAQPADAERTLRRFALNALLAPLIDPDTATLRWADPGLVPGCTEASAVQIDGAPLEVGAAIPTGPFTLSWSMVDCMPFGNASMALSGGVTLEVAAGETSAQATVHAERLRVDGAPAGADLAQPFSASLAYARQAAH